MWLRRFDIHLGQDGFPAVIAAAKNGHAAVVALLCDRGADLETKVKNQENVCIYM